MLSLVISGSTDLEGSVGVAAAAREQGQIFITKGRDQRSRGRGVCGSARPGSEVESGCQ